MLNSKVQTACLSLTLPLVLGACSMRKQPPIGATGAEIYDASACASCHGDSLEGSATAPSLLGLSAVWDRYELGVFIGNPEPFYEHNERLQKLDSDFSSNMLEYSNLSSDELDLLAGYLLSN
jgi:mono/diheme cytochrome c family protein